MVFVAETDEKRYKQNIAVMAKYEKVRLLQDLVTFDGSIELSQQQV